MVASGVLWAVAAYLWLSPPVDSRIRSWVLSREPGRRRPDGPGRLALVAAAAGGAATALVVGGPAGWALGVLVAVVCHRSLRRLEPRSIRVRREGIARQAPLVADLLDATLASGAGLQESLRAVSEAIGEPTASSIRPVITAMGLGADAPTAWLLAEDEGALEPIGEAIVRAARTGAPLAVVLARIGDDLRRKHRTAGVVAARSAGVRAVAPLAACFLPAFVLLGVVPVVVSLASSLFDVA